MKRVVCEKERCIGCLACVVACLDEHYNETETEAVSGRIYEKAVSARTGMQCYKTRSCLHCVAAPCARACRFGGIYQDESGYVRTDRARCTGCRACQKACPFDIPRFDAGNKISKCDGCVERICQGLEPACVRVCPAGALTMKDTQI